MRKEEVVQTVLVEFYRTNNMGESTITHEVPKSLWERINKLDKSKRPGSWKTARIVQVAEELDLGIKKKPIVTDLTKDEEEEPKRRGPKSKVKEENTDETE